VDQFEGLLYLESYFLNMRMWTIYVGGATKITSVLKSFLKDLIGVQKYAIKYF